MNTTPQKIYQRLSNYIDRNSEYIDDSTQHIDLPTNFAKVSTKTTNQSHTPSRAKEKAPSISCKINRFFIK